MPTTADIGLGIGIRINDRSVVGIALNYKLGMGTIQHIQFTHQGAGIRSYIDWKMKKQFYLSGGYEFSHNTSFEKFSDLKDYKSWQPACLFGLSKILKIKTKYIKETKFSILYNALSYKSVPTTFPWIFRIGYTF
jgi:hypothetical protein